MNLYNYDVILNDVIQEVTPLYGSDRMTYHINPVVKNALRLAEKLDADKEVVELAAYFHDITRVTGDKENHHNSSAEWAVRFLKKYNYPAGKISLIEKAIRHHRGSVEFKRETVEEKIIATADSMAHIQCPATFFHKWYKEQRVSLETGIQKTKEKMARSWRKIEFDFVKEEMQGFYNYLQEVVLK